MQGLPGAKGVREGGCLLEACNEEHVVMGLLDDLAMGLGIKERTEDYDARTADTIAANKVAADRGDASNAMYLAQARNPDHASYFGNYEPAMQARDDYLFGIGGTTYNPQAASAADDANFFQSLLFSAPVSEVNPVSPRRLAVGPFDLEQPVTAYSPLTLLSNMLGGLQNATGANDPLTSSAFAKFNEEYGVY